MAERHRYEHRPDAGETHSPRSKHGIDGQDPHHPLNTPADEAPESAAGQAPHTKGMKGRPPARGERYADEPLPAADE